MTPARMEAFTDGVVAIIITIMVLELHVPHEADLHALTELCPKFVSYILSFIYVGIYWNNHHHLLHTLKRVTGGVMWANLHLLFWLSLFPFVTGWAGEHPTEPLPIALYGVVLLIAALAWLVLQHAIIEAGGTLHKAIGSDWKGKLSPVCYLGGIGSAFVRPWLAPMFYGLVALLWIVPDRRIEAGVDSEFRRRKL
jgi:uncharacterized membrane protein